MEQRPKLSRYMTPSQDEARLDREWNGILDGLADHGRKRVVRTVGAVAAACVLVAGGFLAYLSFMPAEQTAFHDGARAMAKSLTLPDGTEVNMDERADIQVSSASREAVRIDMTRGRVRFNVPKVKGRKFTVGAGNILVEVVGTRFTVAVLERGKEARVEVSVNEGAVRIHDLDQGTEVALESGRTWSSVFKEAKALHARPSEIEPEVADEVLSDEDNSPEKAIASKKHRGASVKPREEDVDDEIPGDLFKRAQQANLSGDPQKAAALFDEFVMNHQVDSRSPVAAFQLGRLRMDALGDIPGALRAFDMAIKLGPGYPFIEDVEARRVEALERLGQTARCRSAKQAYLAKYPSGVHMGSVERRCLD